MINAVKAISLRAAVKHAIFNDFVKSKLKRIFDDTINSRFAIRSNHLIFTDANPRIFVDEARRFSFPGIRFAHDSPSGSLPDNISRMKLFGFEFFQPNKKTALVAEALTNEEDFFPTL